MRYFDLNKFFNKDQSRSLIIGGGAFIYPRRYLNDFRDSEVDVVEIDSEIVQIAKKFFSFQENPRIRIFNEDGRVFVNNITNLVYDSIILDAFSSSCTVPFHLLTKEAMLLYRKGLKENGVILINLISTLDSAVFKNIYLTLEDVFPKVYVFAVQAQELAKLRQNIVLIAKKNSEDIPFVSNDPFINNCLQHRWQKPPLVDGFILRDDFAPIDLIS